jgi:hypothetical protein
MALFHTLPLNSQPPTFNNSIVKEHGVLQFLAAEDSSNTAGS